MKNLTRKISRIKFNAYKLKKEGQIPSLLFDEIMALDQNSTLDHVSMLIELTSHLMRIKGYYFRFSEVELGVDKTIKEFKETRKGGK